VKRSVRFAVVAVVAMALAGCAADQASPSALAPSEVTSAASSNQPTAPVGDFGSHYVGTPVAFWFWAPY